MNKRFLTAAGLALAALLPSPALADAGTQARDCPSCQGSAQQTAREGRRKQILGRRSVRTRTEKRVRYDDGSERVGQDDGRRRRKKAKRRGDHRRKKKARRRGGQRRRRGGTPPQGGGGGRGGRGGPH